MVIILPPWHRETSPVSENFPARPPPATFDDYLHVGAGAFKQLLPVQMSTAAKMIRKGTSGKRWAIVPPV
jgi:hypothetical protein